MHTIVFLLRKIIFIYAKKINKKVNKQQEQKEALFLMTVL